MGMCVCMCVCVCVACVYEYRTWGCVCVCVCVCVHMCVCMCTTDPGIPFFSQWSLQVHPQAGMLLPSAFIGVNQPYRQLSSSVQPVQTT